MLLAIPWGQIFGYIGGLFFIGTSSMKTMVPLRAMSIAGSLCFIAWGWWEALWPTVFLHVVLVPLNSVRLVQMVKLTRRVHRASTDGEMSWLKPFMTRRKVKEGEILFTKGAEADAMYFIVTGHFRLVESGIDLPVGEVAGELGLLAPDNRRTQTMQCTGAGEVLVISYEQVRELYYQNPEFGFWLLRLSTGRLFTNMKRMEEQLAVRGAAPAVPAEEPLEPVREAAAQDRAAMPQEAPP